MAYRYCRVARQMVAQMVAVGFLSAMIAGYSSSARGASKDLGNGFRDHGVAVPISNHRGTVATVDGQGRNVLLVLLMDHRGGYSVLMLDAQTGKAEQFPIPFDNVKLDSPYASLLSSANKFYTHFGDFFVEFDPVKRGFTFCNKTTPQMSMGMTEDDNGVIWSVSYPQSGVVSFDPRTRKFRDYGEVYNQNWMEYPRFAAADDSGWVYFAIGMTASQIIALDPATGKGEPMLKEEKRAKGTAFVYRDLDGKVYGQARQAADEEWYEFYKGVGRSIGTGHKQQPKRIITGSQALSHLVFPDGSAVKSCNLVDRKLTVQDAGTSSIRELSFDYASEGAMIMGMALASDGNICGGTAFPMRFFSLDPKADVLTQRPAYGQWNTVARHRDRFFVGGYPEGYLLEWDPAKSWVNTDRNKADSNPRFLTQVSPVIHRPHDLLPICDGRLVVMSGTPQYGYTGGGLLIWDRETSSQVVLRAEDLIPDESIFSMVELPGRKILAGTTTRPGTGGEKKATEAQMLVFDPAARKIEWKAPLLPGTQEYTDLFVAPDGLIYGIADRKVFFVFDAAKKKMIYQKNVERELGISASEQGPRIFICTPEKHVYVLFEKGIVRVDTVTHKLTLVEKSPVVIECGGDYVNGRIYFGAGSHVYSYGIGSTGAGEK